MAEGKHTLQNIRPEGLKPLERETRETDCQSPRSRIPKPPAENACIGLEILESMFTEGRKPFQVPTLMVENPGTFKMRSDDEPSASRL